MTPGVVLIVTCALAVSVLLTGIARKLAIRGGVLDLPNERSSHSSATPRGGGVSIVVVTTATAVLLALAGKLQVREFAAYCGGGLIVALTGFADDRRSVAPVVRLLLHVAAAVWAIVCLGGLPPLQVGSQLIQLGWIGNLLGVLAIVWTLNLFNFMDGIDGIAASEALFILCAASFLTLGGGASGTGALALAFAAACAGFLWWNWPPARIFMGDVGSGYIGFLIAVLAVGAGRSHPTAIWIWLILGGVFFIDSTTTLVRRALRGDRVDVAHRSHAYQWLSRRWRSHLKVTLVVAAINLLWLLPCAGFAALHPQHASVTVLLAFAPLVVLALGAGAGRRESVPV